MAACLQREPSKRPAMVELFATPSVAAKWAEIQAPPAAAVGKAAAVGPKTKASPRERVPSSSPAAAVQRNNNKPSPLAPSAVAAGRPIQQPVSHDEPPVRRPPSAGGRRPSSRQEAAEGGQRVGDRQRRPGSAHGLKAVLQAKGSAAARQQVGGGGGGGGGNRRPGVGGGAKQTPERHRAGAVGVAGVKRPPPMKPMVPAAMAAAAPIAPAGGAMWAGGEPGHRKPAGSAAAAAAREGAALPEVVGRRAKGHARMPAPAAAPAAVVSAAKPVRSGGGIVVHDAVAAAAVADAGPEGDCWQDYADVLPPALVNQLRAGTPDIAAAPRSQLAVPEPEPERPAGGGGGAAAAEEAEEAGWLKKLAEQDEKSSEKEGLEEDFRVVELGLPVRPEPTNFDCGFDDAGAEVWTGQQVRNPGPGWSNRSQ